MGILSKVILITGITGFTGFHLANSLREKGAVVWGLANGSKGLNDSKIYNADLGDKKRVLEIIQSVRPDYIIHLAGISFAAHDSALPYYNVNVLGTQNILDACIASELSPEKIILASSAAVYGDPKTEFTSESQHFNPQGHYGCSKLSMEFIAQSYMSKLPILTTRPFNYTGVRQPDHFLVPKIVKHFKNRADVIELGNTNIIREFSDVRDVVNAYIALLDQPESGVVNLCSGIGYSFEKLIKTLEDITGHEIEIRENQEFVRATDIVRLVGNPDKLKLMSRTHYKHTLEDTLTWMLECN